MESVILRGIAALTGSPVLTVLALAVPLAITIAGFAGWRQKVPNALSLGLWGGVLSLWLLAPLDFTLVELDQIRRMFSFLGWFWLVKAWLVFVTREWPAPIWAHWIAGTLLLALAIGAAVVLIRAY